MKRILSILLVVCIVLTLLPSVALAAGDSAQWGVSGTGGSAPDIWTSGTLAEAMTYANGLPEGTAYIQLLTDTYTSGPLVFEVGKTTILDLNSNDINRGLTNSSAPLNGNVITVNGKLTLKDSTITVADQGAITGGNSTNSGGVLIGSGGIFIMQGGNITGNKSGVGGGGVNVDGSFTMQGGNITKNESTNSGGGGGGVLIGSGGSFIMQGGGIAENKAVNWGGGVYAHGSFTMTGGTITGNKSYMGGIYFGGNFNVGGTAVIKDNLRTGGTLELNVVRANTPISVTTPLTTGAHIGVTAYPEPKSTNPVNITNTNSADYSSYFLSDDSKFAIQNGTNNVVKLVLLAPEMNVKGNSNSIADGDATPSLTDHTDFENAEISSGRVVRTFTIENLGTDTLNLSGASIVEISGMDAADFTVTTQPSLTTVASSESITFQVTFDPSTAGAKTATISIASDDSDENPYDFNIRGTGTVASEMNVKGNGTSIVDGDVTPSSGDHSDFGNAAVTGGTISRTFTIENTGLGLLTLSADPKVSISGTDAADFTVTTQPSSPIEETTGTTTFTVQFDPSTTGTRTATINIANNDSDENPYDFSIQGVGIAGAQIATSSAGSLTPTAGEDDAITFTVKDALGNTDTNFDGAHNVTITGVEAAPDGTYGSFNGTVLTSDSSVTGQAIDVTFADGVATPNLKLNKADAQTIGFSIAGVTTPATDSITVTQTHGATESMTVTQDITAPATNGGQFAQQPKITLTDAYGNICTGDNGTVITISKKDAGSWTLTGTTTATAISGVATFTNQGATNVSQVTGAQLAFSSGSLVEVASSAVTLPAPAGAQAATSSAGTLFPTVGVDDAITLTVKDILNNTDTNFDGAHNVTITGVEAAPDGTYGNFNGMALDSTAAGAGQVISVTFANGVATPGLKLNKADAQTIGCSIATVTTPATNTLTITPTHGTAASMAVTQNITAPTTNGGNFAQQPKITLKDAYGNICANDNTTVVTAAKEDGGTWNLIGATTTTASSGVATFINLGAANAALVNNAQLCFTSGAMTKVTSTAVTLPAPVVTSSGGGGSSTNTTPVQTTIVIVNGVQQNAGTETTSTEKGQSIVTVAVNNNVIESKIDEAVKNNTAGDDNVIQVPITNTKSEIAKVELTGDIVKKLEEHNFDVSVKHDNVEYIIPAEEFTISNVANQLGVSKAFLQDIKIEVQITKSDASVFAKYNGIANANGAELVFPPVSFEVVAKTTKADGTTQELEISKFSGYVERIMEIPAGVDQSKITTGIVFNTDGTYSHVPTEVFQKEGKWYARLNSLTNSTYSVIWNPITVKSVEKHWSKDAVNDMASRLVIFNPEAFNPNKAITRADFAEYIVRALGLYREGSKHENKFKDISANGDRTLAIQIANEYGIVAGYLDGTFRPNTLITREEAMAMYQRAMKITKLVGTDNDRCQSYTDYNQVGSWATSYVKAVLSAHVFNGTTATTISPKSNLTYAEAAQAIKNLLIESKLINK